MPRTLTTRFSTLLLACALAAQALAQDDLGGPAGPEQLQALITTGTEQLQNGEFDATIATMNQVIESGGAYSSAPYLLRAKAFAGLEEYESALEDLTKAETYVSATPQLTPELKNTRAEIFMELQAFQAALPELQAAAKIARGAPKLQFNLGKVLVKLGGADQGEKSLTKFLESELAEQNDELRAEALALRGQAYGALGKDEEANADFDGSLAIDPSQHEPYMGRATLAMRNEDYQAAIDAFEQAIENYTPPKGSEKYPFIQAHLTRAASYEELGKAAVGEEDATAAYQGAIDECDRLLGMLPDDDPNTAAARAASYFRRGVNERLLGDYTAAVKSLTQATQLNPGLGEAYFRRGICYHYKGEEKLAIRDFEQAASINFDSPRSNLWKGLSWAKMGDYHEAIRAYGESIAVSDRYIPAFVNRGLAYIQQGEYDKAIDDLNEAIRLQPNEATHYYRRGKAYALSGDSERAIQSYMSAIEQDERLASAYSALANELRATDRGELAAEYERRAAQLEL